MSNKKIVFNSKIKTENLNSINNSEDEINEKLEKFADAYVKKGTAVSDSNFNLLKEEKDIDQKFSVKRTTLYLPKDLHIELKLTSTKKDMSMGDIVVEALRRYFKNN